MGYNRKDFYFHKAKTENYAARSVFKLEEMDNRFKILKPGHHVIDLGAAPGSWAQYTSKKVGPKGRVLGIDLQPIKLTLPNATFLNADLRDLELERAIQTTGIPVPFDVVLSDMAPRTTGIRITDQARSVELCELALSIAVRFLKPRGTFVCKLFHSEDFEEFRDHVRKHFAKVEVIRPKSTRAESKEIFFVATQFNGQLQTDTSSQSE